MTSVPGASAWGRTSHILGGVLRCDEQTPSIDLLQQPETLLDTTSYEDLRAWALMNLGIVEAWSGRTAVGAQHLERARKLSRRSGRRYLEVGCLAHFAATVRNSIVRAQAACNEAIEIATQNGWDADPVVAPPLVALATAFGQTGRFDEEERWLDRAERTLRVELEPAVGCLLYGTRGALNLARRARPPERPWSRAPSSTWSADENRYELMFVTEREQRPTAMVGHALAGQRPRAARQAHRHDRRRPPARSSHQPEGMP